MCEKTDKPNIFNYATKELSQDAVICWLIDWAHYNDKQEYEQLKQCGQKFIETMFSKHGKKAPRNPGKVKIWRQYNRIDVLVDIGEFVLLIEDKIDGKPDIEQLTRYYNQVVQMVRDGTVLMGKSEENVLPIFLKTGNHSLYEQVIGVEHLIPPYKVFDRRDFLKVVEDYDATHPILDDFSDRLKCWNRTTESFKNWDQAKEWEYTPCQGFFRELENHLTVFDGDSGLVGFDSTTSINGVTEGNTWRGNSAGNLFWGWDWVNNNSGGFFGFWWYSKTVQSCGHDVDIYLQLEIKLDEPDDRKLCFKVAMKEADKDKWGNIKWDCHERILKSAGKTLVRKPQRMGHGYTVTIAEWISPWLIFNPNDGPDIQKTIGKLMEAQRVLDKAEGVIS